jgi:uncharacterized protein YkwD
MRKVLVPGLMIGLLMMVFAGCPKTQITNLPPNVPQDQVQAWYAATGAVKMIAQSTKGLTDTVVDDADAAFNDVINRVNAERAKANLPPLPMPTTG